jgi:hypothetical protein
MIIIKVCGAIKEEEPFVFQEPKSSMTHFLIMNIPRFNFEGAKHLWIQFQRLLT